MAFLFFDAYIHRFGVSKLKHTALEAEGKSSRGEHRGTEGEGGRSRLHSSTLHTAATDSSCPSSCVHPAKATAFNINNVAFTSSLKLFFRGRWFPAATKWVASGSMVLQTALPWAHGWFRCQCTGNRSLRMCQVWTASGKLLEARILTQSQRSATQWPFPSNRLLLSVSCTRKPQAADSGELSARS